MQAKAKQLLEFASSAELLDAAKQRQLFGQSHFILGGGSNCIFCQDFNGTIIRLTSNQLNVVSDEQFHYLQVDAGFNWHQLVKYTVEQGIYGLENLALIPGSVGAAPIQNIGAYGLELSDVLDYVEFIDKQSLTVQRLKVDELQLGYRDSIFKHQLANKVVITQVGFKLKKQWQANTGYAGLQGLTDAKAIFEQVVAMRQSKLPDPATIPNAGSFFKNPYISQAHFTQLKQAFADIPGFASDGDSIKVPAAWLIERCGLKGHEIGGVRVYPHHALVLTNFSNGTGQQLLNLVEHIRNVVKQTFKIELQIEVRLIGANGLVEYCDYD